MNTMNNQNSLISQQKHNSSELTPTEYSFNTISDLLKASIEWGVDMHTAEMRLMRGERWNERDSH